jgi:hypothetical protein
MKKTFWIVLIIILALIFLAIRSSSKLTSDLPQVEIQMGTSTVVTTGGGVQVGTSNSMNGANAQKENPNLTPLIIRTEGQESIMKYNFSCVKGRTMDAQLSLGGKTESAEVVIYDSSLSKDGQIETRTFTLPLTSSTPDQRFTSQDGTVEFVFNGATGTVLEYGKATLYKECRMTATEIIK